MTCAGSLAHLFAKSMLFSERMCQGASTSGSPLDLVHGASLLGLIANGEDLLPHQRMRGGGWGLALTSIGFLGKKGEKGGASSRDLLR